MNPFEQFEQQLSKATETLHSDIERSACEWIEQNGQLSLGLGAGDNARVWFNTFGDDALEKTGIDIEGIASSRTIEELTQELIAYRKKHDDGPDGFIAIAEDLEAAAKLLRAEVANDRQRAS